MAFLKLSKAMKAIKPARKTKRVRTVKLRTNGENRVDAASTIKLPTQFGPLSRILRPQSPFQWLMPAIGQITPTYIEGVLRGAMMGNNVQQWELFDLMLKSWPELLACYTELVQGVLRKDLIYEAFAEEDEQPTPSAIERSKLVSTALRRMAPEADRDDCDLRQTIHDLLDAWFRGLSVSELLWQSIDTDDQGTIAGPKSTTWVHPNNYAFDNSGRLGLRPLNQRGNPTTYPFSSTSLQPRPEQLDSFSNYPNKFLIAMHKVSAGSIAGGELLRPLAWWWCAANFSSDWLLNLAQVFGLPFRWATYDANAPQATIDAICTMLQNMGSAGWAAFPVGTTLELMQPTGAHGSDHSPQGELLDRADRYARLLILGQTMTGTHGTMGKGGGQAFGKVEHEVKEDRIDAAGKFVADIINQQLIPMILTLNYGDAEESPSVRFLEDQEAGLPEAQRDQTLANAGLKIGVDYLRKKYDIPPPSQGEDTIGGEKPVSPQFGGFGPASKAGFDRQQDNQPNEQKQSDQQDQTDMAAGDLPGHEFHGNQYTSGQTVNVPDPKEQHGRTLHLIGELSKTSEGLAEINAAKRRLGWISQGSHPRDPHILIGEMTKSERGLAEINAAKRRLDWIGAKFAELFAIEDDAVFSRELSKLAGAILPVDTSPVVAEDEPAPVPDPAPPPPPQVINVHVEAPVTPEPVKKSFIITRQDGTVVEGDITNEIT